MVKNEVYKSMFADVYTDFDERKVTHSYRYFSSDSRLLEAAVITVEKVPDSKYKLHVKYSPDLPKGEKPALLNK